LSSHGFPPQLLPGDPAVRLAGRRIVVTRAADQASALASQLRNLGAIVVLAPTIRTEPMAFTLPDGLAWVVVTSPNGVTALASHPVGETPVAVVGPGTAEAARSAGLNVALIPPRSLAECLVEAFPSADVVGGVVAVVQADIARPTVVDGLRAKGWTVTAITAYRTLPVEVDPSVVAAVRTADVITFTSASTARSFVAAYGTDSLPPIVVSIGPVTSDACAELAVPVTLTAERHDIDGLITAVLAALT
jgi:uroporphyrinogen III methyltransferase / synthase